MKRSVPFFVLLTCVLAAASIALRAGSGPGAAPAQAIARTPAEREEMIRRAEAYDAEGSWALAHGIWSALAADPGLPAAEARRVAFRAADTLWRSEASTQTADTTRLEEARAALEKLLEAYARQEDRDALYALIHEALGDYHWARPGWRNWPQAWQHYHEALAWWAASPDIDRARARYLGIVWRVDRPPRAEPWERYGAWGNQVPAEIAENAVAIAATAEDRARAHHLLAMTLRQAAGDRRAHRRTREAFEAAIAHGRAGDWYDDALFQMAEWLAGQGTWIRTEGGGWAARPDYPAALQVYRRLTAEFRKGESRWYDQAAARIEEITRPSVAVSVSHVFFPGSEIQYHLNWRNLEAVELAIYPVDLIDDVRLEERDSSAAWIQRISLLGKRPVRRWTHLTQDGGRHVPGHASPALAEKLPAGAWILEATGGGESARDLILVSGATILMKASPSRAIVFMADARDGSPRPGARVAIRTRRHLGKRGTWTWESREGTTDRDGIARFDLPPGERGVEILASAVDRSDQAFTVTWGEPFVAEADTWRIYAFTDRPVYRPGETARWKLIARRRGPAGWETPAGGTIAWEILDPRGARAAEGEASLNAFGSAWGEFPATDTMTLGEYAVTFRDRREGSVLGTTALFRIEEYRRPEFQVRVTPPVEEGRAKVFRTGDAIEAEIEATYYFGGPVAGATVEVVVTAAPFFIARPMPHEFPWLHGEIAPPSMPRAPSGQVVHTATLRTDATGRARVVFSTPAGATQDMEYVVEARVTDASRREIAGQGRVRVARHPYHVFLRPDHNLHRPGDTVRVVVESIDANERPLAASGMVKVTRERWVERWIDPQGREVTGAALDRARRALPVFPPPPERPDGPAWRPRFRGYETEEILVRPIRTDAEGRGEITFRPDRDGYYRIVWTSEEEDESPVHAETTVWVADRDTQDLGYHRGGVGILLDRDTVRAGQPAPVLLTADVSGAWVLFSVASDDLHDLRVVHLTGTAKLIEIAIDDRHVPNVVLEAAMVQGGEVHIDRQEVVVPPEKHFLQVEVTSDREEYGPREAGRFTITARDHEGHPVAAEVALGVIDASLLAIQEEYAADPRRVFYGDRRAHRVGFASGLDQRRYADLVRGKDDTLIDRRHAGARERDEAAGMGGDLPVMHRVDHLRAAAPPAAKSLAVAEMADMAGRVASEAFGQGLAEGEAYQPAVTVRSDFRATAYWQPDVVTGEDGHAVVEVTFPDSLTTWKATARAATRESRFGAGDVQARTNQPLIVRLQAPRFLVAGDDATISAVVNNNTDEELSVRPTLRATGLEVIGGAGSVRVPAGGEARVDWHARARTAGTARLEVSANAGAHADAMEMPLPVFEHGVEKLLARAGKLRGEEAVLRFDLPAHRPGSARLTVRVTPSLAVTMLDALPYLIDYPYGCTEQTMSRFLPAVIVMRALERTGIDRGAIARRIFGGIEADHAEATHPGGAKDLARLDEIIRQGLDRLYDFQHPDGGWGWWKEGESDPFMSAYVVWGLGIAAEAGVNVRRGALDRGAAFLDTALVNQEENHDLQAFMLHAVTSLRRAATPFQRQAFDNLWDGRDRLNAYTRALVALSAHHMGQHDRAQVLARNLANGVKRDARPDASVLLRGEPGGAAETMGTAHWGEDGIRWRWSEGKVESTAFALKALLAIDPDNALIEPVTHWLVRNRRGAQWSNTRDTAIAVLAMTDYLTRTGEAKAEVDYAVTVNGTQVAERRVGPGEAIAAPAAVAVDPALLLDGRNEVRIARRAGDGALYFAAEMSFFSLEEPVTAAGNECFIRRNHYRRVGRPTLLAGTVYHEEPILDRGVTVSGDRVEVVITVEAKNDYEYLVFEDLKPAGLEAVALRSGEGIEAREIRRSAQARDPGAREPQDYTGRSRAVHQELRDRKVAIFVDRLPQGIWEIRYEMRAEQPGAFHALPATGHAMYVPEIRCNGEEIRLTVEDRADVGGR